MPIQGLTNQPKTGPRAMAILRKGSPKRKNNKGKEIQGIDLDYFRLDPQFESREMCASVNEIFHQAYGPEPRKIDIWLLDPDPLRNFEAWMESYGPGYLKVRCDRQSTVLWYNGYRYVQGERPCKFSEETQSCPEGCKQVGRFLFWIPEIFKAGYSGPIMLETHSKHDIAHLDQTLQWCKTMSNSMSGVTMTLERVQEEITRPAFNQSGDRVEGRGKMKSWLLRLSPPAQWVEQRNLAAAQQQFMLPPGAMPALPSARPMQLPQALPSMPTTSETVSEPLDAEIMEDPIPEVAERIQVLQELTGCPFKLIERLAHKMGKTVGHLSEPDSRRLRSLVFCEWAALDRNSTVQEIGLLFKEFWGNGRTGTDQELFHHWKAYVQKISTI